MNKFNPKAAHYMLARLDQQDLICLIRRASGDNELVLWEMIGLNSFYEIHTAGPQTAGKLGINVGEVIGYKIPGGGGHFMGAAIGDLENQIPMQPPPVKDIIGTIRWRYQLAKKR